ncbi:methylated-DNA--[protein]-cysteine S-methyltransferase [Mesobacterium sp. TK19101]|uniref:Methylated-DNA--protein-cysteine methyltransferase n=1 Tax=Mesobacterium hydrothermale TaxID=3111907 RepID=A0ABU6HKK8_9RHOB|nr:methylated-DNA--[protein]-cysteine S-methyltransferase [Mesobacterium sp. TK19101]MEC3861695.1 methylated-DNA--[protein]-cysteine S-methyltransferase [Mesobacterium sp. TK19101]
MTVNLRYRFVDSPIGALLLVGDDRGLHRLGFAQGPRAFGPDPAWRQASGAFAEVARQVSAYFAGELRTFDVPLVLSGTDFQTRHWRAMPTLPYGRTQSYGAWAAHLGVPRAVRAIGAANGANPIPIILPCHRLVAADGNLTRFGGGLSAKRFLLALEARHR